MLIDGSTITDLHTDENGYTWHVMRREGGSMSLYATRPGVGLHFVVYDTLDEQPPDERAGRVLDRLEEAYKEIGRLLWAARGPEDFQTRYIPGYGRIVEH